MPPRVVERERIVPKLCVEKYNAVGLPVTCEERGNEAISYFHRGKNLDCFVTKSVPRNDSAHRTVASINF